MDRGARETADRVRRRRDARCRQLGNTWMPEFVALACEPIECEPTVVDAGDYFPGIWDTNVIDGPRTACRGTSTRASCSIAATCWRRPDSRAAATWPEWIDMLGAIKRRGGTDRTPFCCRSTSSSRCWRSRCSKTSRCCATRTARGNFRSDGFRRALGFYLEMFGAASRRRRAAIKIANVWDEFARGYFSFYISGPWNIGEFKRRLPAEPAGELDDGAAARPERAGRLDRRRLEPRRVPRVPAQGRRRGS